MFNILTGSVVSISSYFFTQFTYFVASDRDLTMGRRTRCHRSADNESQQISQLYPEKCGSGKSSRGTSKFIKHAYTHRHALACILAQKHSV